MILMLIFGIIVGNATQLQFKYEHCKTNEFKTEYCKTQKFMHEYNKKEVVEKEETAE